MRGKFISVVLLCVYLAIIEIVPGRFEKNELVLKFLDVGQGDAIFIRTPSGKKILVDGGPDYTVSGALYGDLPPWTCSLDVVILSHPHSDHLAGLNRMLENCSVGLVLFNHSEYESGQYFAWLKKISNIKVRNFTKGDSIKFGDVTLYSLWPPEGRSYPDNVNNESIVVLVDYGKTEILLTGDAENEVQYELDYEFMDSMIDGKLEVLKAAHHGSSGALGKKMILETQPENFVISVGRDNRYGHPHPDVIEFMKNYGANVFRTDETGTVEFKF